MCIHDASEAPNSSCHFVQLNDSSILSSEQYEQIASLIYQTDKYIFPDMFGNEVIAKTIVPLLLKEKQDKMFCLDNLYVCFISNTIAGIVLWCDGQLNWNSAELRKCAAEKGINLPSELDAVEKEYIVSYSDDDRAKHISILNLCVDPHIRGKGIGAKLLNSFIDSNKGRSFELCVLSDNESAISLYHNCGFKETCEEQAYPKSNPELRRKVMVRLETLQ